uniref:Uncharacterized protein n=1 Tax=Glossina brevipalpis TaxID=37001 RepID=A0A1A9X3L0_9MUSC
MYKSFLSTQKLWSFNKTCFYVKPFNGFGVERFKATALNLAEKLDDSTIKASITTKTTTTTTTTSAAANNATTLTCIQSHHNHHKPEQQQPALELKDNLSPNTKLPITGGQLTQENNIALEEQKLKSPYLLNFVLTNRKLSFYDTSNGPSTEDTSR